MYRLQTHPVLDYCAGHDQHGEAILFGLRYPHIVAVLFDRAGRFLEIRVRPLGFEAPTVHSQGPYITEDPFFLERVKDRLLLWQDEFGFVEGPIVVDCFRIPELLIGIDDLPRHLKKFLKAPADFSSDEQSNYPEIIRDWTTDGNCVLWWGREYYLNKDGEVI